MTGCAIQFRGKAPPIVVVSTLGGAHYTASKAGLLGLTRAAAKEWADLICFIASEAAGYMTGTALDINGGDLMM